MNIISPVPGLARLLLVASLLVPAATLPATNGEPEAWSISTIRPLPPNYRIDTDGSVSFRLCYNWSCATRETVRFTAADMARIEQLMDACPDDSIQNRLQRLRIGIWQMEELAEKYQPLLVNDQGTNEADREFPGRTDCIDNTTNTTTFLHILRDMGKIPGWSIAPPEARNLLLISGVHWTAVVSDRQDGGLWSVDSWYRPNGHLPFVMPLTDWSRDRLGWDPPLDKLNPYPRYANQLCST